MLSVTGDWMYNALDQLVLDAPQPPWTSDGWVLSPVDLHSLPVYTKRQQKTGLGTQKSDASLLSSGSNVTLETTAMKARLECETVPIPDNTWLTDEVKAIEKEAGGTIKNISVEHLNLTGALLPIRLFENTTYDTTTFASPERVLCCLNETAGSESAVAYWSQSFSLKNENLLVDEDSPSNFSIKWIVGPATTTTMTIYTNNQPSVFTPLQFEEVPAIQMLQCKPVIEQAQARVTVARSSGQVVDFKLLEEPRPRPDAWGKRFDIGQPTRGNKKRQRTQDLPYGSNYTANFGYVPFADKSFNGSQLSFVIHRTLLTCVMRYSSLHSFQTHTHMTIANNHQFWHLLYDPTSDRCKQWQMEPGEWESFKIRRRI
jgi:hypothetical protein